jgi:hypothetical protein
VPFVQGQPIHLSNGYYRSSKISLSRVRKELNIKLLQQGSNASTVVKVRVGEPDGGTGYLELLDARGYLVRITTRINYDPFVGLRAPEDAAVLRKGCNFYGFKF